MDSPLHDTVAACLAAGGHRYTRSRQALVDLLSAAGRPLPVDDILARPPRLPRGSVYRNLGVLQECGVVHAIAGHDDFTRYELDEALMGHHHHLACLSCGSLVDVRFSSQLETNLAGEILRSAEVAGFAPTSHRLDILGVCGPCQST